MQFIIKGSYFSAANKFPKNKQAIKQTLGHSSNHTQASIQAFQNFILNAYGEF
jgi:hypothetical protein